jgi:hypothetical protein
MPATTLSQAAQIENRWLLSSLQPVKSRNSLRIRLFSRPANLREKFAAELSAGPGGRDQRGCTLLKERLGNQIAKFCGLGTRGRLLDRQPLRTVGM